MERLDRLIGFRGIVFYLFRFFPYMFTFFLTCLLLFRCMQICKILPEPGCSVTKIEFSRTTATIILDFDRPSHNISRDIRDYELDHNQILKTAQIQLNVTFCLSSSKKKINVFLGGIMFLLMLLSYKQSMGFKSKKIPSKNSRLRGEDQKVSF